MNSLDRLLHEEGFPEQDRLSAATDILANLMERTNDFRDILELLQTAYHGYVGGIYRELEEAREG